MAKTVFEVLDAKIEELKASNIEFLEQGAAKDYAEYRESCGVIRGLSAAQREIKDLSRNYMDDEDAQDNFRQLKVLLDEVNVEDRGCTEKVYRGLCSETAEPGHLSHLERPNYDFAHYLNSRVGNYG